MALSEKEYAAIRAELDDCENPLFFFDDDPDGLCSFLQFYRYKKKGHSMVVKSAPRIDHKFLRKVEENEPDKIFILDIALVEQEFLDSVNVPVIWVDHHGPYGRDRVKLFNPRVKNMEDNLPTSYLCHRVVQQDIWIAMVGCIGDWHMPDFKEAFIEAYPEYLSADIRRPEDALFTSKVGQLVKIMANILKGPMADVLKSIKILTRIAHPDEIINKETPRGRFIAMRSEKTDKAYRQMLKRALEAVTDDSLIVFTYHDDRMSFTKELANEILYLHPGKNLIIGRIKSGEVKCSIRGADVILPPLVEKALRGVEGYGGGHEHACGANVKENDFHQFVRNFREALDGAASK